MDELLALAAVRTHTDLASLVERLVDDLAARPDGWENADLASYLTALAAWLRDSEGWYRNRGEAVPESPDWRTLGEALLAARVYE